SRFRLCHLVENSPHHFRIDGECDRQRFVARDDGALVRAESGRLARSLRPSSRRSAEQKQTGCERNPKTHSRHLSSPLPRSRRPCPHRASILPFGCPRTAPCGLRVRVRKPAFSQATTTLRQVSVDISTARNRAKFDWSNVPGFSAQ